MAAVGIHAVVPLKGLQHGKRRLAAVLSPVQRASVVRAMAEHVLCVLCSVSEISRVLVLTNDATLVPVGCTQLRDPGPDLNAAVAFAGRAIESIGGSAMLIVAADLPLVDANDIRCMIAAGRNHSLVLAADARSTGTNAMMISPPASFTPLFGVGSLEAHRAAARTLRRSVHLLHRPGLACDIDEPSDLSNLAGCR